MMMRLMAGMVLGAIAGLLATRALRMRTSFRLVGATRPLGAMITGAIVGLLFASPLLYAPRSELVIPVRSVEQLKTAIAREPVVLVDFYADWCGPCLAMKSVITKLADHYEGRIKVLAVNVDENAEITQRWKVQSIPDIRVYKNGKLEKMNQGYRPFKSYCEELDLLLKE